MVPITYNLRNLIERKATTLMTALGIGLTVAVLITSVALSRGLQSVFDHTGNPRHFIVLRRGTDAELTSQISHELYESVRTLPEVARDKNNNPMVSPEGLSVVNLKSPEYPEGMNLTVRGLNAMGFAIRDNLKITQGSAFKAGVREAIVGEAVARRYPDAAIGNKLHFGNGDWNIVGIFSAGESAANSEIWVDLSQFNDNFKRGSDSSSLLVAVNDPSQIPPLKQKFDDTQTLGGSVISEPDYYTSLTDDFAARFLKILGYLVAAVMAVGSAFAATNTMYAAVSRRTREIGTLRALGFSRFSILMSFMMESIFLALIGGLAGTLLAFPINGVSAGVGNFQTFSDVTFKFQVGMIPIAAGLLFAAVIGAVGGFLPAWSAARKNIIQAMRET